MGKKFKSLTSNTHEGLNNIYFFTQLVEYKLVKTTVENNVALSANTGIPCSVTQQLHASASTLEKHRHQAPADRYHFPGETPHVH